MAKLLADRHRRYFLLVDVTTAAVIATLIWYMWPGLEEAGSQTLAAVLHIAALILPLILVFGKGMRDEFAEQCWRDAAITSIKAIILLPILSFFAGMVDGFRGASGDPGQPAPLLDGLSPFTTLGYVWIVILTIYVLSFQWHRWKAMR